VIEKSNLRCNESIKKKVWNVRSKKDLVDATCKKHKCSKTKVIKMVGVVSSSYYRVPGEGEKGNKPATHTFHNIEGFVTQDTAVVAGR
jgi:putative transposase